ncbi:MAG: hypothetical protein R3247_16115 [Rhodothermales bacterium]|nr:hypothetical protein [Rhodothermales bacterium]
MPHLIRFALAALLLLAVPVLAGCSGGEKMTAEERAAAEREAQLGRLAGDWAGQLNALGSSLRIVVHVRRAPDGTLSATLDSPDQGATGIRATDVSFEDGRFVMEVGSIGGTYTGTLQPDADVLDGQWTQGGQTFALNLRRTGG